MKRSLAAAFCLAVVCPVGSASAQAAHPLDVLGVSLGMPREQAVHVFVSHKPPYSVTNTVGLTVEDIGPSVWHVSLSSPPDLIYNSVDTIDLDFAPPPNASTVLRIYRNLCYNCGTSGKINPGAPSVANFLRSIADKLKAPAPTVVVGRSQYAGTTAAETSVYVWTAAGEFLSSAELHRRLRYPARCTNPPTLDTARNNGGVSFDLSFDDKNFANVCGTIAQVHWQQQNGIITQFDLTISDIAGLVSAFSKSDALIRAKNASRHHHQQQRANQNRPNL